MRNKEPCYCDEKYTCEYCKEQIAENFWGFDNIDEVAEEEIWA